MKRATLWQRERPNVEDQSKTPNRINTSRLPGLVAQRLNISKLSQFGEHTYEPVILEVGALASYVKGSTISRATCTGNETFWYQEWR